MRFEKLLIAILERTMRMEQRIERMESRLDDVAIDVDELDRHARPYGDGTRTRRRRR
jgi:hypothetical protein